MSAKNAVKNANNLPWSMTFMRGGPTRALKEFEESVALSGNSKNESHARVRCPAYIRN